ncbi:response regulator [Eubacteriales bacterium OttesenSCG-928-A19]|nr:response regulator [Eubacteriales bacterium OttesenSCG-928-A19]
MWKIVVVDDNPQVIGGLRRFIEQSGLDVVCVGDACDGQEALEVIRATNPDIVLTDICMPVMDGLEMIERLKAQEYPGAIIILSGYADFQYAQQAIRFQVNDYLLTPTTLPELRAVLEKVLAELSKRGSIVISGLGWRDNHRHKETVSFMVQYIHEHYQEDICLEDLSKQLFLSRNYLNQVFKRETGETFTNYLIRVRMEKAKELLLGGQYFIYEVAEMVGYSNAPYFSNLFRKLTGYKPSDLGRGGK